MSSNTDKPIFIITLGPTGSGKSSLVKKVIKHYNLKIHASSFTKILIDDIIEDNRLL
jgi:pantothenate kinase-related protein Tda10